MSRNCTALLAGTAIALIVPVPASAAPGGVLVETQLADPDPGYVPPRIERKAASTRQKAKSPTLDEAFESFGQAIGQAAQIMHQKAVDRTVQARDAGDPPKD